MQESKSIAINLDPKSLEILKKVDSIHRDSMINIGLALVEKTGYFKTLSGINASEILEDVASLDLGGETVNTAKPAQEEVKKPSTSWDAF